MQCLCTLVLLFNLFSHKVIEQIEGRNSKLKEELVTTKEQLNRTILDKDCLEQEKAEQGEALRKAELLNAELGKGFYRF